MWRAVSPVIAIALLVAIVAVGSVTTFYWTMSYTSNQPIPQTSPSAYTVTMVYPDSNNYGCNSISLKNTGGSAIRDLILEVRNYLTGERAGINGSQVNLSAIINITEDLQPGVTKTYNFSIRGGSFNKISLAPGNYLLRPVSGAPAVLEQGFTCSAAGGTGFVQAYLLTGVNEKFGNSVYCSANTFILENSKTKFFAASSPITNGTCDGPMPGYERYSVSPMRIWSKHTDTTYRVNNVILDETHLGIYDTATRYFTTSNLSQFSASNGQITINANISPASPYFTGGIRYDMLPDDSKYVKITLWAKNNNDSARAMQFFWSGDQDPPSGTWYNNTYANCGICAGNTCTSGLNATKWIAFARCSGNDSYGIIAPNASVLRVNIYSGPELWSPWTTVNPGATYEFSFYLASDVRGVDGEEWRMIEDIYESIYG